MVNQGGDIHIVYKPAALRAIAGACLRRDEGDDAVRREVEREGDSSTSHLRPLLIPQAIRGAEIRVRIVCGCA